MKTIEELKKYIKENILNRNQKSWYLFKNYIPELFEYTNCLPKERTISERIYFFMNIYK